MIPEVSSKLERFRILPARAAYRQIVKLLNEHCKEARSEMLPREANLFLTVVRFDAEVCNGGLAQYFTNPSGKNYLSVIEGLSCSGLHDQKGILQRWLHLLPPNFDQTQANEVGAFIFSNGGKLAESQRLDAEYYQLKEDFCSKMVQWALRT